MFKTFEERYTMYLNFLKESPQTTGKDYGTHLDNIEINRKDTKRILSKKDIKHIGNLPLGDINFDLYYDDSDDLKELYIINNSYPEISGYFFYNEKDDGGVEEKGVWNHFKNIGLIRHLYVNWILKKYDYIMSDELHSTQAQRMWKKLFYDFKSDSRYLIFVLDLKTNKEISVDDWENVLYYYGNSKHNYRLILKNRDNHEKHL